MTGRACLPTRQSTGNSIGGFSWLHTECDHAKKPHDAKSVVAKEGDFAETLICQGRRGRQEGKFAKDGNFAEFARDNHFAQEGDVAEEDDFAKEGDVAETANLPQRLT
jgi:hypothetical protein